MPVIAAVPLLIPLVLAMMLGVIGVGVWAVLVLPRLLRQRALEARHPRPIEASGPTRPGRPQPRPQQRKSWLEGDDLLQYPQRLAILEHGLERSHGEALGQAEHLRSRGERVSAKEGRSELASRYSEDASMLERRAASMRRVMGLVWRTRAILTLRAHVAITARARPDLEHLPEGSIPPEELERAAQLYDDAADEVRAYVKTVESRLSDLHLAVPGAPRVAELDAEDEAAVQEELARARETYAELQDRMDRLADTLSYLSDRCHTRQVVEHSAQGVDGLAGSEGLLDEVGEALHALNDLAALGDRQLADTAMDNLAEDISQLEQAGLDARAEADAALEVAKLLEQFPRQAP